MLFTDSPINDHDHNDDDDATAARAVGRTRGRPTLAVAGGALLALGVASAVGGLAPAAHAAQAAGYTAPPLAWTACQNLPAPPEGAPTPENLECADLTVPLDYAKPQGETIKIALIRVKATDQASRLGSLVFNFGGPGQSGVDSFAEGAAAGYESLNVRYDLVSFDPRGVGRSSPVICQDDAQKEAMLAETDETKAAKQQQDYLQGCQQRSGKILPHVGTVNAAKDLEAMRTALGDQKLHYFGLSYGTQLGASYAHQFPGNVGHLVLDAAVNSKLSLAQAAQDQTKGFELAFTHFAEWAAEQETALGETEQEVNTNLETFLEEVETKPIPTNDSRMLTRDLAEASVLTALYSKDSWPDLLQAILEAAHGNGTTLLAMVDDYSGRDANGHYDNSQDAATAITCADTTERPTEQNSSESLPCIGWPVKGDDTAKEAAAPGAAPIVVIGNTGDPATPYAWAGALADQIGTSARLLTLNGEGHASYGTGSNCIDQAVDDYLLDGTVPADDTTCSYDTEDL
jgi:pimeloyl-ACP methyl ester carboxylesterase